MTKIFTRSQLQTLKSEFANMLSVVEDKRLHFKRNSKLYKKQADKNDASTLEKFKLHSIYRSQYRDTKRQSAQLELVQRKIKRILSASKNETTEEFTQKELHIIKAFLNQQIRICSEISSDRKQEVTFLWDRVDKNNPETSAHFELLNRHKDLARYYKKVELRLAEIQHTLKKELYRGAL